MKVILLQDVKKLGARGDIVEVADGYGQNFLFPRRLAAPATEGAVKARKSEIAAASARDQRERDAAKEWATKLEAKPLNLSVKAGDGGKLFGSITTKEIAAGIKKQHGYAVDKKKIHLPKPIKSLGTHQVTIKLYPKVTATVTVELAPDAS